MSSIDRTFAFAALGRSRARTAAKTVPGDRQRIEPSGVERLLLVAFACGRFAAGSRRSLRTGAQAPSHRRAGAPCRRQQEQQHQPRARHRRQAPRPAAAAAASPSAAVAGFVSTSANADGAATVATVKSRLRITGTRPSGNLMFEMCKLSPISMPARSAFDELRDVLGRTEELDLVAHDVEHAAALQTRRVAVIVEVHRDEQSGCARPPRGAGSRRGSGVR